MLVFGFGISTDVNNLSFAVLDHDQSHESRAYLEELRGSPYFVEKTAARRLCRPREAAAERRHQRRHRDPARLRPRHRARPAGLGRCLDRWRNAVRGPDDPRLSAGHAPALSRRSRGKDDTGQQPPPPANGRDPLQIQPGFRQHLRDGAVDDGDAAGAVSRRS